MAPEQVVSARNVDVRADVWSLGAVLYMLLTGMSPFRGKDIADTLASVVHRPLRLPQEIRPEIPPDVADIVVRCLRKDPKQRIPTAHALGVELSSALARTRTFGTADRGTTIQQGNTPSDAPAVLDATVPVIANGGTKMALLALLSVLAVMAVVSGLAFTIRGIDRSRVRAISRFESTESRDASTRVEISDAGATRD
jgi:serine/threonine protein kinase